MLGRRDLEDAVVVVTGASSGIGRAAALAFADRGAHVVAAARREEPLREVAEECSRRQGRSSLPFVLDVSDEEAVRSLAQRAVTEFGRVDVWVNNAAVTMFGRLEDAPMEEIRRVIDVNLFGYLHGARAVLPHFREQRHGVLINNASMVAKVSEPYVGPYVMSKHAIRALGMVLRQELALDGVGRDIRVCTVLPATIDTPLFQHGANHTGRAVKALPPVYPAERVARTIVNLAQRPRREVLVGNAARMLQAQFSLAPGLTERMVATMVDRQHLRQDRPAEPTSGTLFEPMDQWTSADGGWNGRGRTRMRRLATAGAAAAAGVALARRRSR
jgi:NAD(P)-dependent dehydrogenase (short-subunit alcohol dehydrogenase family)